MTMENINLKINGIEVSSKRFHYPGSSRLAHIEIPTLCFLKEINEIGACRMCVVEVKGAEAGSFLCLSD